MSQSVLSKFARVALLAALLSLISRAGETAVEIHDGVSILENWKKDQHVYLVGDLGVRPDLLDGLEKWIDENAPNWTVHFLESATGESYPNVLGDTSRGIDAVEDAMRASSHDWKESPRTPSGRLCKWQKRNIATEIPTTGIRCAT